MKIKLVILSLFLLSGCGTVVPNLTYMGNDRLLVEDVHVSIRCELIYAVHEAQRQAGDIAAFRNRKVNFFKKWGVKYTLTLRVVEDTTLAPTINVLSPTTPVPMLNPGDSVFTLNTGLALSAKATRTETDQSFNTVEVLGRQSVCKDKPRNRIVVFGNNLGIQKWLTTRLGLVDSRIITSLTEKESFTYEVKFEIGKRGNVDPKWAFIQRNLSGAGGLFNTGRATSHSVLITFGPAADKRTKLANEADAIHNARLIGASINR